MPLPLNKINFEGIGNSSNNGKDKEFNALPEFDELPEIAALPDFESLPDLDLGINEESTLNINNPYDFVFDNEINDDGAESIDNMENKNDDDVFTYDEKTSDNELQNLDESFSYDPNDESYDDEPFEDLEEIERQNELFEEKLKNDNIPSIDDFDDNEFDQDLIDDDKESLLIIFKEKIGNLLGKIRNRNEKPVITGELVENDDESLEVEEEEETSELLDKLMEDYENDEARKDNDDEENEDNEDDNDEKPSTKELLLAPFKIIGKLYSFVVAFVFSIITFVLNVLSKIPIIGKLFAILLGMTKLIEGIAKYLPIVFILLAALLSNYIHFNKENVVELPDFGSVKVIETIYDKESGVATVTLNNNGATIANVTPKVNVFVNEYSLNPVKWFVPTLINECSGKESIIEIDETIKVDVQCDISVKGIYPRARGDVEYNG